jgi:hypothetical protein
MAVHTVQGGGGLRLHVREWGKADGPPILFIHGLSQNHLCWAKQCQSFLADDLPTNISGMRGLVKGWPARPYPPEEVETLLCSAMTVPACAGQLPGCRGLLVRRCRPHPVLGGPRALQPRAGRPDPRRVTAGSLAPDRRIWAVPSRR